jgi:hypothetical protein
MSQSAAQAAAFFKDVARTGRLWTIWDEGGYPAPLTSGGQRAQPFWSTEARARRIINTASVYAAFDLELIDLDAWRESWLPDLRRNGLLVGLNWTGARARGYDFTPDEVIARLDATGTKPPS